MIKEEKREDLMDKMKIGKINHGITLLIENKGRKKMMTR